MGGERWHRIEELFHAAAALPADGRAAFLHQACGDDHALKQEVESLLGYSDAADSAIDQSAIDVAARLMAGDLAATETPLTGAVIGHLRVGAQIGEGGMGIVYEAEDTRLGRTVAIKFLSPRIAVRPRARERFEREARAASALNHPNICTIHSVQEHDGRPFIEMERLDGESLRERVAKGPLPARDVMRIARDVADALAAAHAKGIIHRDLTPANIVSTGRGAKVLDFGIATLDPTAEDARAITGTPAYMSPEQRAGQVLDGRSDLYSLGAVMHELITGRPFDGAIDPTLPRPLQSIVTRLLQPDREHRYATADALLHDLDRLAASRSNRWKWVAALVTIAMAAAAAAFVVSNRRAAFDTDLTLRQVTHNASEFSVRGGAISPDGRWVVYSDPRGVHLLSLETNETIPTPFASVAERWDVTPGWLPDNRRFVVNARRRDHVPADAIWIAGVNQEPRVLREDATALSVSPDGAWIAFAASGEWPARSIWLMDTGGGNVRKLFEADEGARILELSWSPDAGRVAYGKRDRSGMSSVIETRALSGGAPTVVVTPQPSESLQGSMWLRDGRLIYSVTQPLMGTSAGTVPCTHWQVPMGGDGRALGTPRPLAGWLPQCVAGVSVTSDSRSALYLQFALQDTIRLAPLTAGAPVASRRLTATEGRNIPSGWSPDGRSVIYISDSGGRLALVRQDVNADVAQRLTDEPGIVGAARLTPRGDAVLYLVSDGRRRSNQRLRRVSIGGGGSEEIASGAFVEGARCAAAPATLCAIAERQDGGRTLVFLAIDQHRGKGAELRRVPVDASSDYRWALSANGKEIALIEPSKPVIRFITIADGSTRTVTVDGTPRLGYVSFLPDGSGVLVPAYNSSGATLMEVSRDGRTRPVWHQPGAVDISGIPSPDGTQVAIWIRSRNASLWLAESR